MLGLHWLAVFSCVPRLCNISQSCCCWMQDFSGASRSLSRIQFIDLAWSSVGHGSEEEYGFLFDSVVLSQQRNGLLLDSDTSKEKECIDWGGLCSFLLMELSNKLKNNKTVSAPCWKPPRTLTCPHRDPVQKVKGPSRDLHEEKFVMRVIACCLFSFFFPSNQWPSACYLKTFWHWQSRESKTLLTGWNCTLLNIVEGNVQKVLGSCSSKWLTPLEINGSGLL